MDSKGRIVLPQEIRDRLGITPGTEVEIHEEAKKVVVEPEAIIERMERLVEETAASGRETTALENDVDPVTSKHRDAVRRGIETDSDE